MLGEQPTDGAAEMGANPPIRKDPDSKKSGKRKRKSTSNANSMGPSPADDVSEIFNDIFEFQDSQLQQTRMDEHRMDEDDVAVLPAKLIDALLARC